MRIGIIFHSVTGNTRQVAQILHDALEKRSIDADLLEIKASADDPDEVGVTIDERPDLSSYDKLVFAAPVHAFNLSRVMRTYLKEIDDLSGVETAMFITHHFPFAWMGGTQALNTMKRLLVKKGARVTTRTSINWSSSRRDEAIRSMCDTILT
jgi:flavodoxin